MVHHTIKAASLLAFGVMTMASVAAHAETEIKINGFVKLDSIYSRFSDGAPISAARDFYAPGLTPVVPGGGETKEYLDMHAKESRLAVQTSTKVGDYTLGSFAAVDFIVNPGSTADERFANAYTPGLRQFYLTFGPITAGQDYTTFQNMVALPESLDFSGWPADGTPFIRQALVRYTQGGFDISLENPNTLVTNATNNRLIADESVLPDVAARYRFGSGGNVFSIAGLLRQLRYDGGTPIVNVQALPARSSDTLGYGASFAGKVTFDPNNDIRFTVSGGRGIGRYLAYNAVNDVQIGSDGKLDGIDVYNGFLAYRHVWSQHWHSTLMGAYLRANHDTDVIGESVSRDIYSAAINLIYIPVEPVWIGVEYRHASRELESGDAGQLDRVQFSLKYLFSWGTRI
ncbi:DcaP family trimeric outer membrane transporter [Hydrocarboniphaga sp.]|jgi:hypothetical protein|uniref:DcaP family trimeric outer membrane transporter n=1 Tax=Hydrocarboniphaga sp. TaxID=2033016 RepID=UPI002AB8FA8D|nr:DcaP family trimeric outer membrane transporter [Hydrocarboniphaga sp.]MDZ4078473.1 DcaP family trimeric outer membrane transporter [Hydrocarboniphaga sp.]